MSYIEVGRVSAEKLAVMDTKKEALKRAKKRPEVETPTESLNPPPAGTEEPGDDLLPVNPNDPSSLNPPDSGNVVDPGSAAAGGGMGLVLGALAAVGGLWWWSKRKKA